MKNPLQIFRQSSTIFEKTGILSEKVKILTNSNYHRVQYFLLRLRTRFLLPISTKGCLRFFQFHFDLELLVKVKTIWFLHTRFFTFSLIIQDLNRIKKNPEHSFGEIVKQETCAKFQPKVLKSVLTGARQSLQFSRQATWFLGNDGALSKFSSPGTDVLSL